MLPSKGFVEFTLLDNTCCITQGPDSKDIGPLVDRTTSDADGRLMVKGMLIAIRNEQDNLWKCF